MTPVFLLTTEAKTIIVVPGSIPIVMRSFAKF
jgi:hypothetical protein